MFLSFLQREVQVNCSLLLEHFPDLKNECMKLVYKASQQQQQNKVLPTIFVEENENTGLTPGPESFQLTDTFHLNPAALVRAPPERGERRKILQSGRGRDIVKEAAGRLQSLLPHYSLRLSVSPLIKVSQIY